MASDERPDDYAELRVIWEQHRATTFARVEALEHAVGQAQQRSLQPAERQTARREAHALAGGVAFFGFLEGARIASELERMLDEATPDPERLRDLVTRLRGSLGGLPYTLRTDTMREEGGS